MIRQKRTAVAAVALATLVVAGTATAASGADPTPGTTKAAAVGKPATADPDLLAAATTLGVTPDALTAAIVGAKQSFANATHTVSNDDFVAAVAGRLGLPTARVGQALAPMIAAPGRGGDKADGKGKDTANPADSPFATEAAAQAFAASTGVSVDRARAALAAVLRLAGTDGGLDTDSAGFRAIADQLGLTTDQLMTALGQLKASLKDR
jgi:2-hydroxychromene-2-carboxylate isomerase